MSSAWKSWRKGHRTPPSDTSATFGLEDEDEIRRLTDTFIVNDLKGEYYYSQNDVVIDAFRSHLDILEGDPELYLEIINSLRPVMLECQKVIAALYLWDRDLDKELALELLKEVRPTWKTTFFYMLKKATPELGLRHRGWGRSVRRLAKEFLLGALTPFYSIKYRSKLRNLARWGHIRPDKAPLVYMFGKWKKDPELRKILEEEEYFKDYLKIIQDPSIKNLYSTSLPFTILKGILGKRTNEPTVFKAILHTMTVWETLLSLRQIEARGLMDDPDIQEMVARKLSSDSLREMRIDVVELLQAYRSTSHPFTRLMLENAIKSQISAMTESLTKYLEGRDVAVVFDTSGSMWHVMDWSLSLSLVCSMVNPEDTKLIAFADEVATLPIPTEEKLILNVYRGMVPSGGTALGKGLMEALKHRPDIIIYISDFEGNIAPWSDNVYEEYVKVFGRFPEVISIKFVTSPSTSYGEISALRTGRWLGIPNEHKLVIRNLWDLPNLLEYVFHLLPLLLRRKDRYKVVGLV